MRTSLSSEPTTTMFTLILCLLIACIVPYLAKIPVVIAMQAEPGGYDNDHPRAQQAKLTGFGARAVAAHQNSFESLIIFSAAILTALATKHLDPSIQYLAVGHLLARCVYHLLYLFNLATLRSTIWAVGLLCSLSMIWLCLP